MGEEGSLPSLVARVLPPLPPTPPHPPPPPTKHTCMHSHTKIKFMDILGWKRKGLGRGVGQAHVHQISYLKICQLEICK